MTERNCALVCVFFFLFATERTNSTLMIKRVKQKHTNVHTMHKKSNLGDFDPEPECHALWTNEHHAPPIGHDAKLKNMISTCPNLIHSNII